MAASRAAELLKSEARFRLIAENAADLITVRFLLRYVTRPLHLFALNPVEVLGFGALWLAVLCVYSATWSGILLFLALNLLFGTLGHLGVEPLPPSVARWRLVRHLGSSTLHATHHAERNAWSRPGTRTSHR